MGRVIGGRAFPAYDRPSKVDEPEFGYDKLGRPLTWEAWMIQQCPPPSVARGSAAGTFVFTGAASGVVT